MRLLHVSDTTEMLWLGSREDVGGPIPAPSGDGTYGQTVVDMRFWLRSARTCVH